MEWKHACIGAGIAGASLLLIAATTAQDGEDPDPAPAAPRALVEVEQQDSAAAGEWRAALEDEDLDRREEAFERLVERARRDRELRETLRAWAGAAGERELAWTSRLALRELRSDTFGGLGRLPDLFEPFGRAGRLRLRDLPMWDRSLRDLFDEWSPRGPLGGLPPGARTQGESFKLESGPDGVKVEVTETEDGKETKKTYEAESLEQLFEAHPELRERVDVRTAPPFGLRFDPDDMRGLLDRLRPGVRDDPFAAPRAGLDTGPRTDVLGVYLREPGQHERAPEGVQEGIGLLVESTLPGTIAERLGVRPGDLLVELNGTPLASAQDVREVLAARRAHEALELELIDDGGARHTLTWRPPDRRPQ